MRSYAGANLGVAQKLVSDPALEVFTSRLHSLWKFLGDSVHESESLELALMQLRKGAWLLRHQPFPPMERVESLVNSGSEILTGMSSEFDGPRKQWIDEIAASRAGVLRFEPSPLKAAVEEVLAQAERDAAETALVLADGTLVREATPYVTGAFPRTSIFTPASYLRSHLQFDRLVAVGTVDDFGFRVFSVSYPKHGSWLLHHDWIAGESEVPSPLASIALRPLQIEIRNDESPRTMAHAVEQTFLSDPEIEYESHRLNRVVQRALGTTHSSSETVVRARAYGLKGQGVVFLGQGESGGQVDALDFDAPEGHRIYRLPVSQVRVGDCLLFRVGESHSASIARMADSLAGQQATHLRSLQMQWKEALKKKLSEMGQERLVRELRSAGFTGEFQTYWLSMSNIGPQSDNDFEILLNFLGQRPDSVVPAMSRLRVLHQQAGVRFRQTLKAEFEHLDVSPLREQGLLVTSVQGESGVAKLGAFVVTSISADDVDVPESLIRDVQGFEV